MWTSVPQIELFLILISSSFGPTSGTGASCTIQMPSSAFSLDKAFIVFCILGSFQHTKFATNFSKSSDGFIDMLTAVRARHLRANPCFALWNNRIGETDNVHSALEHFVGEASG